MPLIRSLASFVSGFFLVLAVASNAASQIVINEIVKEQRTAGSGAVSPDDREFIELYNAGDSPVEIGGWTVGYADVLGDPLFTFADEIPPGTMIAPGGYFVIGDAGVPGVNFTPATGIELYPDLRAQVIELRDDADMLVDAAAYEMFLSNALTVEQQPQVGTGFQGQILSMNANAPNVPQSWSRYLDGRDTDNNGRDFGVLPITPGASNNLPQNDSHTIPDVDGLATGSELSQYHASFVLPRVIEPGVVDTANPRMIPESPQKGKAIVAWDETGGGNTIYSKDLVNSFDLYAYFDTTPLGITAATNDEEWESSIYGIGSSDAFFGNPDPSGGIFVEGTVTQNASTGIGWLYQQYEEPTGAADFTKLMLVDFGEGGDSRAGDWDIIQEIDLSTVDAGWYRLGIDFDPVTGEVVATFDDQEFMFNTSTDLMGTFFVGYRESITEEQDRLELTNPPIFDLFVPDEGLDGDHNGDGFVNAADYVFWRDFLGDAQGYQDWRDNFGDSAGSAAGAAVPEPTSAVLLLAALGGLLAGGRIARITKS